MRISRTCPLPGVCRFAGLQAAGQHQGVRRRCLWRRARRISRSIKAVTALPGWTWRCNQPSAPVVLMLGSYEPTVWNIGWSPGTRILAVLVSGYHAQVDQRTAGGRAATGQQLRQSWTLRLFLCDAQTRPVRSIRSRARFSGARWTWCTPHGRGRSWWETKRRRWLLGDRSGGPRGRGITACPTRRSLARRGWKRESGKGYLREATRGRRQCMAGGAAGPLAGYAAECRWRAAAARLSIYHGYVVLKAVPLPAGLYGAHHGHVFRASRRAAPERQSGSFHAVRFQHDDVSRHPLRSLAGRCAGGAIRRSTGRSGW